MKKLQAFRFELMPSGGQSHDMHRFAGICRFVYNKALAQQKENHANGLKYANAYDMNKWLPGWKKQDPWIGIAPAQSLQAAMKDLHQGFEGGFARRANFPKFKKKGQSASFRFPQGVTLDEANTRIKLPKLGWIRYRKSRQIEGQIKNVTCSFKAGKWFISIQTEMEVFKPLPLGVSAVGIDLVDDLVEIPVL